MKVELLTPYEHLKNMELIATEATLTCHGNTDKLNEKDPKTVLSNIIKNGHESILEHINLTYRIQDISRALLQELSRHRHISLSVESTRHTLKKQLAEWGVHKYDAGVNLPDNFDKYLNNLSHNTIISDPAGFIETAVRGAYPAYVLKNFPDLPNDELKYFIPEFWPTRLILTLNIRELRHILKLRTHSSALMEFRKLGVELFTKVPDKFKYLLEDCVYVG